VRQAKFRPQHASVYITRNISAHFYPYHNSVNFPRIVMKFGPNVKLYMFIVSAKFRSSSFNGKGSKNGLKIAYFTTDSLIHPSKL
jgi:hypothetical protein